MKARIFGLACVAASFVLGSQPLVGTAQLTSSHGISTPPIFPGGEFEAFFPNTFDLNHPKRLNFTGSIQNADLVFSTRVLFWFDWIDPTLPTPYQQSIPIAYDLGPVGTGGGFGNFVTINETYFIPFCPPEVSIHFENIGGGGPVFAAGTFTHECIVPEASMLLILPVLALMAPLAVRRMKSLASG